MTATRLHRPADRTASAPTPARRVAFDALLAVERGVAADEALEQAERPAPLDARDRALALELVYGVLRRRATLDWTLSHSADRPLRALSPPVLTALRLGAYQLLILTRIPPSAAVNEAVALVRHAGLPRSAGFTNAVLRSLTRRPAPPMPDPAVDPIQAMEVRYACPAWLIGRWRARYGVAGAERLCAATLEVPPLTVRANTLRIDREALARSWAERGIRATPTLIAPAGLVVDWQGPVTSLPGFREGDFYIEDEGGQLVAPLLDAGPGERVLDACAAPGGKATHLAALMRNAGELIAVDVSARRLALLAANAARLGATIIRPVAADLRDARKLPSELDRPFDRILVDAPCSGLGVLRRHPDAKWRKAAADLRGHQARQLAILATVAPLLRAGGTLLYSTCSTEPEENEQVVERFCTAHPDFSCESVAPWLPPAGRAYLITDGAFSTVMPRHAEPTMDRFFAARLRKNP